MQEFHQQRHPELMSVLNKIWKIKNEDRNTPLLQKLLLNRGIKTEEETQRFFYPDAARDFHDPFLMKDMARAVKRIGQAIEKNERIMIFGDYDVDGITACAILMRCLRTLRANVSCRLPHRIEDGYGLREKFIKECKKLNVSIVITVDNGISCASEVETANELGIDVIITDHHTVPEKIPRAYAILHPKLPDSGYPFAELTGAGVALKLAQALLQNRMKDPRESIRQLLDLACMGTIADLGELRGENRYIVKEGLQVLENTRWPGLSRLKENAGVQGKISTHDIGFLLSPRINAAGRISHPSHALRLLLHDADQGHIFAQTLERLNRKRQKMMEEVMGTAEEMAAKQTNQPLTIISHKNFHGGIIGLIASKLSEKYFKPAIVMEDRGETLTGSCRSIAQINIVEALAAAKKLLEHFGGHAAAAGFDIKKENLEAFTKKLLAHTEPLLQAKNIQPTIYADCELAHGEISEKTINTLKLLEPFGMGNEAPRFLCKDLPIISFRAMGADNKHLKITSSANGQTIECVGFKLGKFTENLAGAKTLNAICEIEENIWRGRQTLQLTMLDFEAAG